MRAGNQELYRILRISDLQYQSQIMNTKEKLFVLQKIFKI